MIFTQTDVNVISTGNRCPCDDIYSDVNVIFTRDRYQCYLLETDINVDLPETYINVDNYQRDRYQCWKLPETDINADTCIYLRQILVRYLPEIGTLSSTLSAFLIRYRDRATTCWHQKISLFPHPHLTEVILHLWNETQSSVEQCFQLNFYWIKKHLFRLFSRILKYQISYV